MVAQKDDPFLLGFGWPSFRLCRSRNWYKLSTRPGRCRFPCRMGKVVFEGCTTYSVVNQHLTLRQSNKSSIFFGGIFPFRSGRRIRIFLHPGCKQPAVAGSPRYPLNHLLWSTCRSLFLVGDNVGRSSSLHPELDKIWFNFSYCTRFVAKKIQELFACLPPHFKLENNQQKKMWCFENKSDRLRKGQIFFREIRTSIPQKIEVDL